MKRFFNTRYIVCFRPKYSFNQTTQGYLGFRITLLLNPLSLTHIPSYIYTLFTYWEGLTVHYTLSSKGARDKSSWSLLQICFPILCAVAALLPNQVIVCVPASVGFLCALKLCLIELGLMHIPSVPPNSLY